MANITKDFLEHALSAKISNFEVRSGSNVGDGYASTLYSIAVERDLTSEDSGKFKNRSKLDLLLKCFPDNQTRQEFLSAANLFQREFMFYNVLLPKLKRFQEETRNGSNEVFYMPPFPEFFYGRAVDYQNLENGPKVCEDVLENCILLTDLRKDGGFKLANRFLGFDLDHCKLVFAAQAQLHALSWAYKVRTNTCSLQSEFPFLRNNLLDLLSEDVLQKMTAHNLSLIKNALQESPDTCEERKNQLFESLDRYLSISYHVPHLYINDKAANGSTIDKNTILRVTPPPFQTDEPWLVLAHGDCWLNNMLFRYDEETGKPLEVMFIDLQLTREADPFNDVTYNLYTSTTAKFRKEHLEELLCLYTDTFLQVCKDLAVDPLPGFGLSEVKRRFHRAKIMGFSQAIGCLPIFLCEQKDIGDMDKMEGEGVEALMEKLTHMGSSMNGNQIFAERVIGLVNELYDEGVI